MAKYSGGTHAFGQFAFEDPDVWGSDISGHTASDNTYYAFGQGVDLSVSPSNNNQRIVGVGNRNATKTVPLAFNGSASINGTLTHAYWMLGILGSVSDSGTSPYDHTYSESDSIPSMTVDIPVTLGSTDYTRQLLGAVINQGTIRASVGETSTFSLETNYRYESTTQTSTTLNTDTFEPFTFAGGKVELPNGSELASVQSIELTFVNNVNMVNGIGSRFAKGYAPLNREYNLSMTVSITDFDLLKKFYSGSNASSNPSDGTTDIEMADLVLTFNNETTNEQIVITLSNVSFNEDTLTLNPTEVIQEEVTGWANSCSSVVYTNDEETAPVEASNVA